MHWNAFAHVRAIYVMERSERAEIFKEAEVKIVESQLASTTFTCFLAFQ